MDAEDWRDSREERQKWRAEQKAKARPLEHVTVEKKITELAAAQLRVQKALAAPTTVGFARLSARVVIEGAVRAGMDGHELASMKLRMQTWVSYLREFEVDMEAVRANEDYDSKTRAEIIQSMYDLRADRRREIFGV